MDKYVELKILSAAGTAFNAYRTALLESQTVEQLLVAKGICTAEEVGEMRNRVEANSQKVKDATRMLQDTITRTKEVMQECAELTAFDTLFGKALNGESLTEEERQFLEYALYKGDKKK